MISPLAKYKIADLVAVFVLAVFVALLWLDLRLIREEIGVMRAERDFLTAKLLDLRSNKEAAQEKWRELLATRTIKVTAYSSTPDQTDSTPFITASGVRVGDGVVAANFLPFGTKIKLRDAFGEKTFTVLDRMKRGASVDVWFPTREAALAFGVRNLKMEILEQ